MKNKFLSKLFVLALVITSSVVMFACGAQKSVNAKAIEILLDTVPSTIKVGEFDNAGIKAKVTYDDESTAEINVTTSLIPDEYKNLLNTPGIYTIKIAFRNQTTELEVTIVKADNMYEVSFYNAKNQLINSQYVWQGEDATLPSTYASKVEGYALVGWDKSHENITADTKIYGIYVNVENTLNDEYMQNALLNAEKYYIENNHYTVVDYGDESEALFTVKYHYNSATKVGTAQSVMTRNEDSLKYNFTETYYEMLEIDTAYGNSYSKKTYEELKEENPTLTDEEIAIDIANGGMGSYTCQQLLQLATVEYSYELCQNRVIYLATFTVQKEQYVQIYTYKYNDEKLLSMNILGKENSSDNIEEDINFSIEYATYDFEENFIPTFGDVNTDGTINEQDTVLINKHISGSQTLTDNALLSADVNLDGKVDNMDVNILRKYNSSGWGIENLPCSFIFGDVNLDGEVTSKDVLGLAKHNSGTESITGLQLTCADVNMDNEIDIIDETILAYFVQGSWGVTLPYTTNVVYGDVNLDGTVDTQDANELIRYINSTPSGEWTIDNILNADVNTDAEVNYIDAWILFYHVGEWDIELPYESNVLVGDVNLDGSVTEDDLTLLNTHITNSTTSSLTLDAIINADINKDTVVDEDDVTALEELLTQQTA